MFRTRSVTAVVFAIATLVGSFHAGSQEADGSTLLLILDASGSMWGQIEGENKIVIDYSTGEVSLGVTRNGELSDAAYKLLVREIRGERREVTVTVSPGEELVEMVDMAGGE